MVEVAEKTEPKCTQVDCPMFCGGHCIAYKDYEWRTFGTRKCMEETKLLDLWDRRR